MRPCCYSSEGKRTCMPLLETRTDSPGATPAIPQDPCQHWRGILRFRHLLHTRRSTRVPPTTRGDPFPPPDSRRGILSLRGRVRIPGVPVASQEEALSTGKARGTPGSCHIPRVPQMSQSIPGKPVFPTLPRISSRESTHTTVARGTAQWESLVGKP